MAASTGPGPFVLLVLLLFLASISGKSEGATWCVARSDASEQALQTALDYACGAGADCAPIQSSGLCYLPNTVQAHASYAFNSYYQRRSNAPGSCSFSGTATVATTDPSYGSCVYPSSPSTAGGTVGSGGTPVVTTTPGTTPPMNVPTRPPGSTSPLNGGGGGVNPGLGPVLPDSPVPNALPKLSIETKLSHVIFLLVFSFFFQIM